MLIEWGSGAFNLKHISHVLRDRQNCYLTIFIHGSDNYVRWTYDSKEELDSDYKRLMNIIKASENLSVDEQGRFVCTHCGAPN